MLRSILAAIAITGAAATCAGAQELLGQHEYMAACAGCHGEAGKGDGPLAESLTMKVPDLTGMSARNNGVFPFEYAIWMIDGRKVLRMHGSEDMPVWGDRFMASAKASEYSSEAPEVRDLVVRGRVLSLVYYLESIQN